MADELEKYIRANAGGGGVAAVARLLSGADLLLFGETHVKLDVKARFFASLIRHAKASSLFQYFASEHFHNDTRSDGAMVAEYLEGKRAAAKLSADLRVQAPILDAVRESLPRFGVVFAGTKAHDQRDRRIHAHFASSRSLHLKAGRFDARAKGIFHLGADHAGRVPNTGSEKTTCGRLTADGLLVHVVRITVEKESVSTVGPQGFSLDPGEWAIVRERSAPADDPDQHIDLMPILRRAANGKAILVGLNSGRSPFQQVLDADGKAVFADRFDSILHLPG